MNYYVVLRRIQKKKDFVSIYDESEAISRGWVDSKGERIWIVPKEEEYTTTFVWKFPCIDSAISFFEALKTSELGILCVEV